MSGGLSRLVEITATRGARRANAYRLRFADYRLVYEVHATEIVVYVIGIAQRREVYQRILRRQSP